MKNMTDTEILEAVSLFIDKYNSDLLSKDELIKGIRFMTGIRPVSPEAGQLYMDALELIFIGRR